MYSLCDAVCFSYLYGVLIWMAGEPIIDNIFQSTVARDADYAEDNQDASSVDRKIGRIAIADGVSSGFQSAMWARIVSESFVSNGFDFSQALLPTWIVSSRARWGESIDFDSLNYFQKKKFNQVKGGYATVLWLQLGSTICLEADLSTAENLPGKIMLECFSVGDCNLFHFRDGHLITLFPWTASQDYGLAPASLGSTDLGHDKELQSEKCCILCEVGDQFLLSTDAVAEYLTKLLESDEESIDWGFFLNMTEEQFYNMVVEARRGHEITRDDSTIIRFEIGINNEIENSDGCDTTPANLDECFIKWNEESERDLIEKGTQPNDGDLENENLNDSQCD